MSIFIPAKKLGIPQHKNKNDCKFSFIQKELKF